MSTVLHDIVRDVQDIVRGEIRLAKVEMREDATRALWSGAWLAAGAVGVASAWIFLLWTLVFALAMTMPMWAATLVVATMLGAVGSGLVASGLRRIRRLRAMPERTVDSLKETLQWIKQPTK